MACVQRSRTEADDTLTNKMPLAAALLFVAAFYVLMSCNEYAVHRLYMHSRFSSHVDHHAETREDMGLRETQACLDSDAWRGTSFSWPTVALIVLCALPQALLLARCFGFDGAVACATTAVAAAYQGCTWNTLHPQMHGMRDVAWTHGPPTLRGVLPACLLSALVRNHREHHLSRGRRRFNMTLPRAYRLFGTY